MLKKAWLFNQLEDPSKEPRGLVQVVDIAEDCSYMIVSDKFHTLVAIIESEHVIETFCSKFPEINPFNRVRGGIVSLTNFVVKNDTFVVKAFEYKGARGTTPIGSPISVGDEYEKRLSEINILECMISPDQAEILERIEGFSLNESIVETPKKTSKQNVVLASPLFGESSHSSDANTSMDIVPIHPDQDLPTQESIQGIFTQQITPILQESDSQTSSPDPLHLPELDQESPRSVQESNDFEDDEESWQYSPLEEEKEPIEMYNRTPYDQFYNFVTVRKAIRIDDETTEYIEIPNVSTYKRIRKLDQNIFLRHAKK
jgi:hypothetical protein